MYNMGCAYAQKGDMEPALLCLEGALDSGFDDLDAMRADPDLQPIRGEAFSKLISRYVTSQPCCYLRHSLPEPQP